MRNHTRKRTGAGLGLLTLKSGIEREIKMRDSQTIPLAREHAPREGDETSRLFARCACILITQHANLHLECCGS